MEGASGTLAMDVGDFHGCVVRTDGKLFCWGANGAGQLGTGNTTQQISLGSASAVDFGSGVAARIVPVEVAAGGNHTCARLSDGKVFCWGNNSSGEVGQSSGSSFTSPQAVTFGSGVVARAIGAGFTHSCAVLGDGTVRCWGGNAAGQLGDGTTNGSSTPVQVTTSSGNLTDVVAVSVGDFHACAVTVTGAVYCWGGVLGNGSSSNTTRAAAVSLSGPALEVAAGGAHSCALIAGGAVQCWGLGSSGQLGNGSTGNSPTAVNVTLYSNRATHIGVGISHSCAVLDNGLVRCWGAGGAGQLGNGANFDFSVSSPVFSDPSSSYLLSGVVGVAGGLTFTCAVRNSLGGISCWGSASLGQLGDGTTTDKNYAVTSYTPDFYLGTPPFGQLVYSSVHGGAVLASGDNHSCALLEVTYVATGPYTAREVRCWGRNDQGQIGDGTTTNRTSMTAVSGGTAGAVAVAAGASHSCLLTYAGVVSCWGLNSSGQLGDGTTTNRTTPVSVSLSLPAIAITAGDAHTCALLSDSTVRCWGRNRWTDYSPARSGTIGCNDSTTDVFSSPTAVKDGELSGMPTLEGVRAIAAGGRHTCALMAAGTVRCWGLNNWGQVAGGDESSDSRAADAPVYQTGQPAITAIAITAGIDHSCAVMANGQVVCWGDDTLGQLGNGTHNTNFNAVQNTSSTALTNVVAVYGGSRTTCALQANSNVACWGVNGSYQTGISSYSNQHQAIQVGAPSGETGSLDGIIAVSSGADMSCAFRGNGTVLCWGGNAYGELAISATSSTAVPQFCQFPVM